LEDAPEGLDPLDAEDSVLDEILQYASGKQAEGLKSKYAPPPASEDEAIPGVAPEDAEGAPEGETEVTPEQIALLEQLLSQA